VIVQEFRIGDQVFVSTEWGIVAGVVTQLLDLGQPFLMVKVEQTAQVYVVPTAACQPIQTDELDDG
jgi:hypothetical protein